MERFRTPVVVALVAALALTFAAACFFASPAAAERRFVPDGIRAAGVAFGGDAVVTADAAGTGGFCRQPAFATPAIARPLSDGASRPAFAVPGATSAVMPISLQSRPLRI